MKTSRVTAMLLAVTVAAGCSGGMKAQSPNPGGALHAGKRQDVNLSPSAWDPAVLEAYLASMRSESLETELQQRNRVLRSEGESGIVASTSGALAVHAGVETLRRGGNAMDALLATVLTQPALHLGGATSYAGQASIMFYEAKTGNVTSILGGYATTLGEHDPMSIPAYGEPTGRAVLVPGFIAAVERAHELFGSVAFEALLQPAIYVAEHGVPLSPSLSQQMNQRRYVITRLPSGRSIFLDSDGQLPQAGSMFRQPLLAGFLKRVARSGSAYVYRGEWSKEFVDAVRAEGGSMTLEDMHRYQPLVTQLHGLSVRGFEIYGTPSLLEKLRLAEIANLRGMKHYSESADALYWLMKISRVDNVIGPHMSGTGVTAEEVGRAIPELDVSGSSRYTEQTAQNLWKALQTPAWSQLEARAEAEQLKQAESITKLIKDFSGRKQEDKAAAEDARPNHTAGVVVIDRFGNIAVANHSVTSAVWGEVGVFVEGVSVVDPGAFAQAGILAAGPGKLLLSDERHGASACPAIVLKDGAPYLGCGNVGASFDVVAQQGLINMIEYGMTPEQAAQQPLFFKNWPPGEPVRLLADRPGTFSSALLQAVRSKGIDIEATEDPSRVTSGGSWVVAARSPKSGAMSGAVTSGTHSRIASSDTGLVQVADDMMKPAQ